MVARLCVTTMNCVLSESCDRMSANFLEFDSSSRVHFIQDHEGRRVRAMMEQISAIDVSARSPPDKSAMFFRRFPGGVA